MQAAIVRAGANHTQARMAAEAVADHMIIKEAPMKVLFDSI